MPIGKHEAMLDLAPGRPSDCVLARYIRAWIIAKQLEDCYSAHAEPRSATQVNMLRETRAGMLLARTEALAIL